MATSRIDLTNQFLIAMPGMADDTFAGAVVYLCEHTEKGALGLVINKLVVCDDIVVMPVQHTGYFKDQPSFIGAVDQQNMFVQCYLNAFMMIGRNAVNTLSCREQLHSLHEITYIGLSLTAL